MPPHLIFVYNADSGMFNTITDIAHKIISPSTYSCQLCSLTHSYFKVKQEWTGFLQQLNAELEFLHRDEVRNKYALDDMSLPVILLKQDKQLSVWISTEEINHCQNVDALKLLINNRLQQTSSAT